MSRTRAARGPSARHTLRRRQRAVLGVTVWVPVCLGALGGCATSTEEQAAAQAALQFAATWSADPQTACALLAPRSRDELERTSEQSCEEALPSENLPASTVVTRTDLAGHSARVDLDGQTVFLARFDSGWKIVAAGCSKQYDEPSTPYTCQVQGS